MSAILSWPVPPSNFLGGATVDRYLLLGGKVPTQIFHMIWLHSERNHLIDNLDALTNYTGKIIAILSDGRRGSTDWIGFKTKEGSKCLMFSPNFYWTTFNKLVIENGLQLQRNFV